MPRKPISATKLAKKLLQAGGDRMEFLRQHDFKGDEAMKDYQLHRRLCAEFSAEVDRTCEELAKVYGKPFRKGTTDSGGALAHVVQEMETGT